jgi:DNA-binding GntR family transcriptional regulator
MRHPLHGDLDPVGDRSVIGELSQHRLVDGFDIGGIAGQGNPPAGTTTHAQIRPYVKRHETGEAKGAVQASAGSLLPPGSRLPQEELCERFAVSRTPVREALRKLQAKNLVVVVPNKGVTVRLLSRKELLDIYDVRAELEGYSCELAAARITDRCITELDQAQSELEAAVGLLDPAAADDADPAVIQLRIKHANDWFHTAIHQTAGNALLLQVIKDLGDRCPKDYISRALRASPEVRDLNIDEHRRIRAAFGAGDGRAARLAMPARAVHRLSLVQPAGTDRAGGDRARRADRGGGDRPG